ncbi:MAG: protein kinase [Chloroflexi bacterium]|nr:protein kinase [Chloroflexota bacterium]
MTLRDDQQLGQYRVISQLGQGGMATVYRAYHARLDRHVAIKMLHPAFLEDHDFLERFEREARIVARLEHPNIVPIYDIADENGHPYLVMKFIEGRTLKRRLVESPLALADVLHLLPPIAAALDYAHTRGILHRDIKPSNIIIDNQDTPYLTDFGLARMVQTGGSSLSSDMMIGTPHYMSPEQAIGRGDLGPATDVYALGVVLYELIVGVLPFNADTPFAIIHDHIYRALPLPTQINPEVTLEVEQVLLIALAKDPAARYQSAGALMTAFRDAVAASGLQTLSPNRAAVASESMAKLRGSEDYFTLPGAAASTPALPGPAAPPSPPSAATPAAAAAQAAESASTAGTADASKPKRRDVVESSFSFDHVMDQIGDALEDASGIFDNTPSWKKAVLIPDEALSLRRRLEWEFKKRNEFWIHALIFLIINGGLMLVFFGVMPQLAAAFRDEFGSQPWPLIVVFAWGSGLLAHAVETYHETGHRASERARRIRAALRDSFGPDWSNAERNDLKRVRRRVEAPDKKRVEFAQHFVVYLMINAMLFAIFRMTQGLNIPDMLDGDFVMGAIDFPWPILVTIFWGVGLMAHFFEVRAAVRREGVIDRAIERERRRQMRLDLREEKRKNKRKRLTDSQIAASARDDSAVDEALDPPTVRLTSDGEFTDSMMESLDERGQQRSDQR